MSDINYIRQAKRSITKGDLSSAKIAIKSALLQHPNHYEALILDYDIARVEKNITEQKAKLKSLIKQKPEMLQFSIELAKIYIDTKQYEKAPKVFEPLFKLFNHPDLFFNHAWFLTRTAEYQKAICQYEKAIDLNINFKEEVYLNIANILSTWLKEPDKARDYLNKALTINPRYIDAIYNLANLEEDLGHRSKAISLFKKVIDLNPLHGSASARLALASDDENCGDLIYNLEELIKNSKLNRIASCECFYALGKLHDQNQSYAKAFQYWEKANQLNKSQQKQFDGKEFENQVTEIISKYDSEYIKKHSLKTKTQPIFIAGMFRSGSTLLEQMLSSHDRVNAGGELDYFVRHFEAFEMEGLTHTEEIRYRLTKIQRAYDEILKRHGSPELLVTDKRPDNIFYLGLILTIYPSAKILVTKRNLLDNCLSIYSNRFSEKQNYACDIGDIKTYAAQTNKILMHWKNIFKNNIHIVNYDELVADPKAQLTEALKFLNLEWQESCLKFHKLKNLVQTASVWQIRKPLYKNSSGRWINYKNELSKYFREIKADTSYTT